jgi:hypothetical protein
MPPQAMCPADLNQAGEIQIELQRARFGKPVGFKVFENILIEFQLPHFGLSVISNSNFSAFQMDGINPYEDCEIPKLFFEILMNDIAAFRHSLFIWAWIG